MYDVVLLVVYNINVCFSGEGVWSDAGRLSAHWTARIY